MIGFDPARRIADAVLYEGYVLYPYRASSQKNQVRWQFGVLIPRADSEAGSSEPWASQTECLLEPGAACVLRIKLRFLQAQAKTVEQAVAGQADVFRPVASLEVDDALLVSWDEGVEQEVDVVLPLADLLTAGPAAEREIPFAVAGGHAVEPVRPAAGAEIGRVVRQRWPLSGLLRVGGQRLDGPYGLVKLRVRAENVTPTATPIPLAGTNGSSPAPDRDARIRRSLVAAHTLLLLDDGRFLSLLEPPEWARPAAADCANLQTWPVLVGEAGRRDLVLSSPIILYDYPAIAPESDGDLFDATEIDEILTLRTMTLTEAEKREARATDPRAAAIVDRVDAMPPELLDRLHGAIRFVREIETSGQPEVAAERAPRWDPGADPAAAAERTPWWDPGADSSVSPETDHVSIDGVAIAAGSRVRLRPGRRRADAQDMFLVGRLALVEAVLSDVDGNTHLAVTLADDPAADLHQAHGRFLYFAPDEVEPLAEEA